MKYRKIFLIYLLADYSKSIFDFGTPYQINRICLEKRLFRGQSTCAVFCQAESSERLARFCLADITLQIGAGIAVNPALPDGLFGFDQGHAGIDMVHRIQRGS